MLAGQVPGCSMSAVEKLCGQGHSGRTEHYWETVPPCPSGHAAFPQAIHVCGLPARPSDLSRFCGGYAEEGLFGAGTGSHLGHRTSSSHPATGGR